MLPVVFPKTAMGDAFYLSIFIFFILLYKKKNQQCAIVLATVQVGMHSKTIP